MKTNTNLLSFLILTSLLFASCTKSDQNFDQNFEKGVNISSKLEIKKQNRDSLNKLFSKTATELSTVNAELRDVQKGIDSLENLKANLNQATDIFKQKAAKKKSTDNKKALNELKGKQLELTQKVGDKNTLKNLLKEKLDIAKNENSFLEQQKSNALNNGSSMEEIKKIESQITSTKNTIEDYQNEILEIEHEIENLNSEKNKLKESQIEVSRKIRDTYNSQIIIESYNSEEIVEINKNFESLNNTKDSLSKIQSNLKSKLKNLTQNIEDLNLETQSISNNISNTKASIKSQNELQKQQEKDTRNSVILIVVIAVVLAGFLFVLYRIGEKKRKQQ